MMPNTTATSSTTQPLINTGNTGRSKASSAENTTTAPVSTDSVRDASTTDAVTAHAPSATPQTTLKQTAPTPQLLEAAIGAINTSLKSLQKTNLQFSIDDKSGETVVKVMDVEKEEVIRQIPPEEVLALVAFFKEAEAKKSQGVELATQVGRGSATGSAVPEGLLLRTQA